MQEISLWEWTVEREGPLYRAEVTARDTQTSVRFNPSDVREVVSNGAERVVFWNWQHRRFKFYSPPLSQSDFKQEIGAFTQTVFIPESTQAVTGTADGDIVLWDRSLVGLGDGFGRPTDRRAVKVLRLVPAGGATVLTVVDSYLAVGAADGSVRFFDFEFRAAAWFEDLDGGPVTSLSFAASRPALEAEHRAALEAAGGDKALVDLPFSVPDFLVGTANALVVGVEVAAFQEIEPTARRGTLLVQGLDAPVSAVATHPFLPQLAVCADSGALQLWDYEARRLLSVRLFRSDEVSQPLSAAFDPAGKFLAVGGVCGTLRVLSADSLEDWDDPFDHNTFPVTDIRFSPDSTAMAVADAGNHVSLYRFMRPPPGARMGEKPRPFHETQGQPQAQAPEECWVYIGRHQAHTGPVAALEFEPPAPGSPPGAAPRLVSVGEDRYLAEYDVAGSSLAGGVRLSGPRTRVEQVARPTACCWHPALPGQSEPLIVTANDEYKLKLWTAAERSQRRTALGPTYGGPITRLLPLPRPAAAAPADAAAAARSVRGEAHGRGETEGGNDGVSAPHVVGAEYVAYATAEKVVGVMKLPLDGNPHRSMGLIAHPGEVSMIAASHDGRYLVSAGGADMTVNLWEVDTGALDAAVAAAGRGIEPFLSLLDGGSTGQFYQQLRDYFYYAQLRAQGEDVTQKRHVTGSVPLGEIPNLMRALGYYPTEHEVAAMCNEVRFAHFAATGDLTEAIFVDDFVKLYVNHRPVFALGKDDIQRAFEALSLGAAGSGGGGGVLAWRTLLQQLQERGEPLTAREMRRCLAVLVGEGEDPAPSGEITAAEFAERILGFEEALEA